MYINDNNEAITNELLGALSDSEAVVTVLTRKGAISASTCPVDGVIVTGYDFDESGNVTLALPSGAEVLVPKDWIEGFDIG